MVNGMHLHVDEYSYSTFNIADPEASTSMPPSEQILKEFEEALKNMDLPPEKMRTLRGYDLNKKWDLVRDQRRKDMKSVTDPSVYLNKLSVYLDKKHFKKKKKLLAGETSTTILKHLEISLRTNSIAWVRRFLSPENDGLRVLIDYLSQLQEAYSEVFATENLPSTSSSTSSYYTALTSGYSDFSYSNGYAKVPDSPHGAAALNHNNGGFAGSANGKSQQPYEDASSALLMSGSMSGSAIGTRSMLYRATSSVSANLTAFPLVAETGGKTGAVAASSKAAASKSGASTADGVTAAAVEDDVHVCVMCLRAIMNTGMGFTQVFDNKQAIYCIVRSIRHHSQRTKALAITMLSAICMLQCGLEVVLEAFSRFRMDYKEFFRFQTLFAYLVRPREFHIDFMTACINFFNVVLLNAEDKNQRVALQYEFSALGLDEFLLKLLQDDIDESLAEQIYSYQNNVIDVERLFVDSNYCVELRHDNETLQREVSAQRERVQEVEADYIARNALLTKRLGDLVSEKDGLEKEKLSKDQALHTLTRDFREREQKYEKEKTQLESRIQELERTQREIQEGLKIAQRNSTQNVMAVGAPPIVVVGKKTAAAPAPPAPPPPPPGFLGNRRQGASSAAPSAPPPPPPPPGKTIGGVPAGPPPPPPPLLLRAPTTKLLNAEPMTIKKVAKTKYKLPLFNWSALNSNQVRGTVFNELDDEKLIEVLDLSFLEQMFKIGEATDAVNNDMTSSTSTIATITSADQAAAQVSPGATPATASNAGVAGKTSLLGTKRLQNIAITRRKLAKPVAEIMAAVHRFDLSVLPQENVDILVPIVPTAEEVQQYRDYAAKHNGSFDALTPEDQFLAQLMNIERLVQKLHIMSFMAGFDESYNLLVPQVQKVTAASKSIRSAFSFHKIMEIILAVGNAMNGARRTPIYGFRLTSLDSLVILKSPRDRSVTLMHVIAEIVATKFPELLNIADQLKFAEAAAGVNMETINADVKEIETKYSRAVAEQERKGGSESCPKVLNDFLEAVAPKLTQLHDGVKLAHDAFVECAEYYGESPRTVQVDAFFTRIASFVKHFEQALAENETRRANERRQVADEERKAMRQRRRRAGEGAAAAASTANTKNQLIDELNVKFMQSLAGDRSSSTTSTKRNNLKLDSSQINDGDFERIMNGLKDGFFDSSMPLKGGGMRRKKSPSPSPNRPQRFQASSTSAAGTGGHGVTHLVQRDRA